MGEMEMNNDCWSLLAVVKECTRKARLRALAADTPELETATTTASASDLSGSGSGNPFGSLTTVAADSGVKLLSGELIDLYKPFLFHSAACATDTAAVSEKPHQQLIDISALQQSDHNQMLLQGRNRKLGSCAHQCNVHKKRNKFEERTVCRLSLEELSGDKWAWRKYGQKPIKGSPYPRNYYRCSSSKGCTARKQVERSPIDSNVYVVTYTGHHYHPRPPLRNSGGSRVKFFPLDPPEKEPPTDPKVSTPDLDTKSASRTGSVGDIEVKEKTNDNDDDDDDEEGDQYENILIPNSMADSELLAGMEHLVMLGEEYKKKDYKHKKGYEIVLHHNSIGFDPNEGNGMALGIREMELDSTSCPTRVAASQVADHSPEGQGRNIWDNRMNC